MIAAMRHTLPDPMLSQLSELLATQTGLHFPRERWDDLERGMEAAAYEAGNASVQEYVRHILSAPLTHQQTEILASHLTVGETYFFRDSKSFAALEQYVLPGLIDSRRNAGRRLRIWSAGCCTGEEAYSIAILLDRLLPDLAQWNITLLATDINPHFLRKGMEGVYGEWSFRDTPPWVKEQYFKPGRQGRFEIHPRIRKRVTFSCLNLADDVYPSLSNNTNVMDLIFCRNVLMYFTEAWAQKVVGNLHRALMDGGWLIVSPTEASNTLLPQFAPVNFPDAVLYRKAAMDGRQFAQAEYREILAEPQEIPIFFPLPETPQPDAAPAADEKIMASPKQEDPDALRATARLCANQGKLAEAAEWCGQAIAADKLNPQSHYLLATIRQELGQADAAEQALKRALYLAPDFVLAYFSLGNLRLSQGRYAEAERYFGNALALLQEYPFHEIIPESDGLAAGRLTEIINSVLASLPHAATIQA